MDIESAVEQAGVTVFRGRLLESSAAVYQKLKSAFSPRTVPLVQPGGADATLIVLLPGEVQRKESERTVRPWLHWLLFTLALATTTWAGAALQNIDLFRHPERFTAGLPYSLALMAILGIHELGHYFTARRNGMQVTPPYFIPVPFALGTFGAFIRMRSPVENRRHLFDVAVAGPLAGLAVAIPSLLAGLKSSAITFDVAPGGTPVTSSVLFALLSKISLGQTLEAGQSVLLSPLAFAGWLGLLITALNLLPIGQLDGGHIARAMFGQRSGKVISSLSIWGLFLLAVFVWPALLMFALIVFFIAGRTSPPLNDVTPLTSGRRRLGYAAFVILALILIPLPYSLWSVLG